MSVGRRIVRVRGHASTWPVEMEGVMFTGDDHRVPDHESDPAHTPGDGWAGEGGASHFGPATHHEGEAKEKEDAEDDVAE